MPSRALSPTPTIDQASALQCLCSITRNERRARGAILVSGASGLYLSSRGAALVRIVTFG
jgi:hypothetical protein